MTRGRHALCVSNSICFLVCPCPTFTFQLPSNEPSSHRFRLFFSYLAHMPTQPCAPALYRAHPHTHVHARTCRREAAVNYVPHIQDVVQSFSYSSRHQRGFPTQGTAFKQPLTVARAAGRADMLTQWWSECTSLHAFVGTRGPKDAACFRVHADVCNCVWCASPPPIPLLSLLLPSSLLTLPAHRYILHRHWGSILQLRPQPRLVSKRHCGGLRRKRCWPLAGC